ALTSISLKTGASVSGRALARNGEVTLDTNHVGFSACGSSTATASPTASPTASATVTQSATASGTPTSVATASATSTAAPTPTPTATPVGQTPTPQITACCLPRTGGPPLETSGSWWPLLLVAFVMGTLGTVVLVSSLMSSTTQAQRRRD